LLSLNSYLISYFLLNRIITPAAFVLLPFDKYLFFQIASRYAVLTMCVSCRKIIAPLLTFFSSLVSSLLSFFWSPRPLQLYVRTSVPREGPGLLSTPCQRRSKKIVIEIILMLVIVKGNFTLILSLFFNLFLILPILRFSLSP
jgi:hypothetical protein